ncbi:MAG: MFS transporter [Frankiaceae bacterium]
MQLDGTALMSRRAERYLIPATVITTMGNAFQITAAAILVFRATHTALGVGWLFIAASIPQMVFSLPFGQLADKYDRRTLCIVADVLSAVVALALPIWLWLDGPKDIGTYAATFLLAVLTALFLPASSSLIKERIRDERIGPFNARFEMATQAGILMASSAAGFLVQFFGATPLFLVNAGTFVVSALCSIAIGPRFRTAPAESEAATEDAARTASAKRKPLGAVAIRLMVLYGSGTVMVVLTNSLLTVLILQTFRAGPGFIGAVDAVIGASFLIGAAMYARTSPHIPLRWMAIGGYLITCAMQLVLPISLLVLMLAIPVTGFCFAQGRIATRTLLMQAIPVERSGFVFGATQAFGLTYSVSATIGLTTLADHTAVKYGFYGLAILVAATVLIAGVPLLRRSTGAPAPEPALAASAG